MAKILVYIDERSHYFTELAGPAGPMARAINAGKIPEGLQIPSTRKRDGRLAAYPHGELVVVIWEGISRSRPAPGEPTDQPAPLLTLREAQVLQLLADGLANKRIAERLSLTDRTIRIYVKALNAKLGTQSAEESVGKGVMLGLCHPSSRAN
jgi:two-component system, NarL family, nitrate/nitrite response regulator NarL